MALTASHNRPIYFYGLTASRADKTERRFENFKKTAIPFLVEFSNTLYKSETQLI